VATRSKYKILLTPKSINERNCLVQSVTVHYCYVVQVSDCDYQSQSHSLTRVVS